MAKPTERQVELILRISNEVNWWRTTNDIDSPSHWTLIDEFVEHELGGDLDDIDQQQINEGLAMILSVIRHNK